MQGTVPYDFMAVVNSGGDDNCWGFVTIIFDSLKNVTHIWPDVQYLRTLVEWNGYLLHYFLFSACLHMLLLKAKVIFVCYFCLLFFITLVSGLHHSYIPKEVITVLSPSSIWHGTVLSRYYWPYSLGGTVHPHDLFVLHT